MERAKAVEIANVLYDSHPAAAELILEAIHGATPERRFRSAQALRWLDPDEDADRLPTPGADLATRAIRWCLHGRTVRDRRRAAEDVTRLLTELVR